MRVNFLAPTVACVAGLVCSHLLVAFLGSVAASAATTPARDVDDDVVWTVVTEDTIPAARRRTNIVGRYVVVQLSKPALDGVLALAPRESADSTPASTTVLELPLPDGRFSRFRVVETAMLSPELAAAFPQFRTYSGAGIDDRTASAAFGWTDAGFHAVILAAGGSIYIDPYAPGDLALYVVYNESDLRNDRHDGPR